MVADDLIDVNRACFLISGKLDHGNEMALVGLRNQVREKGVELEEQCAATKRLEKELTELREEVVIFSFIRIPNLKYISPSKLFLDMILFVQEING